ncbi:carboxymuconolactone decarboxylase family protein [Pseudorhodoferax soli]|uniref:AhpD family alkylhydroperoxidase n=1 Tax=Pseudorhodoferax soli TaxID=545864 RepID=A0A368XL79_9BURK|nr:carboxymuconolactone decarboxylase family protein [Pseudorhodoferax soli]RCW68670.1 AhpD family alkylhydroperoxidase [Pseudorhodoferax soli]
MSTLTSVPSFDMPALTLDLLDNAPELFSAFREYAEVVQRSAEASMTPRLHAMVRLAVALAIPNEDLASRCLKLARQHASAADIAGAVNAASHLRSGAAIAYGRLVFKLMEPAQASSAEGTGRAQMALDREYMTKLRKASPAPFDAMAKLSMARQKSPVISALDHELISVAIGTVTQCVYCLEVHGNKAKEVGATDQQIADAVHIAIAARYEATLHEWAAVAD